MSLFFEITGGTVHAFLLLGLSFYIVCISQAWSQTARWTYPVPTPSFPVDSTQIGNKPGLDGAGGSFWIFQYYKTSAGVGFRMEWLSKSGKSIYSSELQNTVSTSYSSPIVIRMMPTAVYVMIESNGIVFLRRIQKTLKGFKVTDTPFEQGEPIANQTVERDPLGFFGIVVVDPASFLQLGVRRWSN